MDVNEVPYLDGLNAFRNKEPHVNPYLITLADEEEAWHEWEDGWNHGVWEIGQIND